MIQKFSLRDRLRSFGFAGKGVLDFFMEQHNAVIHAFATVIAVLMGFMVGLSAGEWTAITIVIALVWMAEIFNTALEKLCDFVSPGRNEDIRIIKDLSAAAVMIVSIAALITGFIIFIPKIL
ncbi:MAG: diacylglycerol kinase family protein [Gemmatimonadaceae bacterium]|nr:diacylglycerol kinase family protein [Chitinophagaceae bacterium]